MTWRVGLSLGTVALCAGVATTATAGELPVDVSGTGDLGGAMRPSKAKGQNEAEAGDETPDAAKAKQADGSEASAGDDKAKTPSPEDGEAHVAQAGRGRRDRGNASANSRPDAPDPEDVRVPARVPWRGTAFSWSNSATASALGIGDDFQSTAHQQYTQTFSLGLNYFVIDQDKWSLAVAANPSVSVEITDSQTTTTRREPWFNDLPLSVAYRRRLYTHDELPLAAGMTLNGTLITPTSPASRDSGTYLTTSPRLTLWGVVPMLPEDSSPVLNSLIFGASGRWDHRFGEATTAVNDDFRRSRQNALGQPTSSDVFGFSRLAENTLREGLFVLLSERFGDGMMLQAFAAWSFFQNFLYDKSELVDPATGEPCDVRISTGCVDASGIEDVTGQEDVGTRLNYGFAAGLSYFPMPELGISVSYSNSDNQLGPDGQRQNVFYNPRTATFTAGLAISIDAIYEAASGPRRKSPFFLVAQNEKEEENDKREREERESPTRAPATF